MSRLLILISDAAKTCGVEEFARQTALHLGAATAPLSADMPNFRKTLAGVDDVVLNLPIVAWKKRLISPILAASHARMAGKDVTLILHEWADLATARRISYLPLLPLATRIFFSAPEVMAQFNMTPAAVLATRRRDVLPIPPNFAVPEWTMPSPLSEQLATEHANGKLIIAQFGSIYPKKDPLALLDVADELVRMKHDVRVVFVGSFVGDAIKAEFKQRVAALGLGDRVTVTGYVASAAELYGLFADIDVFLYPLSEGLTSRRASVLAAALSGKPVVVSAPQRPDSLAHHPLFQALLNAGTIQFTPRDATPGALADAVLAARATPARPFTAAREIEAVWQSVAAKLTA